MGVAGYCPGGDWMVSAGFEDVSESIVSQPVEVSDSGRYAEKAYSVLHLIPQDVFECGLHSLDRDLAGGPIRGVWRYLALWGVKGAGPK